jgi:hypothetical protein
VLNYLLDMTLINLHYASEKQSPYKSNYKFHQLITSNSVLSPFSWLSICPSLPWSTYFSSAVPDVFIH